MFDIASSILKDTNALSHKEQGITLSRVPTMYEGFRLAREILSATVDRRTVLYLSGGRTPKDLYKNLANDRKLVPGAIALIDERYGSKFHNNSNEKMIKDTGFLPYSEDRNIPFYPILQEPQLDLATTADNYDMTVRYLFSGFPKSVAILGIGLDGHTAGIAGNRPQLLGQEGFDNPLFNELHKNNFVSSFSDLEGPFKERVTLTFLGLSMVDLYIVLLFGEDKKQALKLVFSEGTEEDIPGRFFKRPDIAKRTLFITDQKV